MSDDRSTNEVSTPDPFGVFRAEWLPDSTLFDLFTRPTYFPELEHPRPSVLIGGRGTGKTTVLRSLSYEGRYALSRKDNVEIDEWPYYGFYYRVNINRITAFSGDELTGDKWQRLFSHYINLLFCGRIVRFLIWREEKGGEPLAPNDLTFCHRVATALRIGDAHNVQELSCAIETGRDQFEAYLNGINPDDLPPLSMQGQPIDLLCDALHSLKRFRTKKFFFIIDEYESFLDYQQAVVNTLIKHSGEFYSFKLGIKDLGWRVRHTLNINEHLSSPADYAQIDIGRELLGPKFATFARQVCDARARASKVAVQSVETLFPSLSMEEEAIELGVESAIANVFHRKDVSEYDDLLRKMSPLEIYLADQWAASKRVPITRILAEIQVSPVKWKERYNNYKYAMLFTIKRGKSGIRKYYSGWNTYVQIADGNIRYLLELVAQARALASQQDLEQDAPIDAATQTEAAQRVGRKNLEELLGVHAKGAQLTKLLLGLGLIFETMAKQPLGHKPEANQFYFADDAITDQIDDLLTAAVMNLALVRMVSTKRETLSARSYDYALHPIFAPFFVFSHRSKRKIMLRPDQIIGLISSPRDAIRQILADNEREIDSDLPDQLQLFGGYYGGLA